MRKPDLIFQVLKLVFETQSVVVFYALSMTVIVLQKLVVVKISRKLGGVYAVSGDVVLKVLNVFASSVPSVLVCPKRVVILGRFSANLGESFLAEHDRLHPCFVQTVGFCEIQDVELNLCRLFSFVDNFEEEPLSVTLRVEIIFEPEVVLYVVDFGSFAEVSRLETAVEYEHVVKGRHRYSILSCFQFAVYTKLGDSLIKLLVKLTRKVSFSSYATKIGFCRLFNFLLREQDVGIDLLNGVLCIVFE